MCFLFPLGAVLMRGNAGALTERHNEVRSTGKATVIRDGLDALRGGEQLLLCGAQTALTPRRGARRIPAESQRKTSRPSGANTLAQFEHPGQSVPKKKLPG